MDIKLDISYFDYDGLVAFIKKHTQSIESKTGFNIAERITDSSMGRAAVYFLLNSAGKVFLNMYLTTIARVSVTELIIREYAGERMSVSIGICSDSTDELFSLAGHFIRTDNETLNNIMINSLNAVRDVLHEDVKNELLYRMVNDSRSDICRYASQHISKRFRVDIEDMEFDIG